MSIGQEVLCDHPDPPPSLAGELVWVFTKNWGFAKKFEKSNFGKFQTIPSELENPLPSPENFGFQKG